MASGDVVSTLKKKFAPQRVLQPGTREYSDAVFIGNLNYRMTMPAAVFQARSVQEVQDIVSIARRGGTRLTVKNGGHSYMGYCLNEGGIVLDMSLMNDCSIDTAAMTVTMQGGAIWKTVYKALLAENDQYIIIGGQCPYVGASGFTLGGGLSPFSRSYGLGCDNLVSMTVVTADSEVVTVSRDDEDEARRDLFWALTGGGGGNFGVTVSMTCKIHKLSDEDGNVVCGDLTWKLPQQQKLFQEAMDAFNSKECPKELTVDALWTHGKRKQFTGGMTVIYNGGMAKAREVLAPYLALGPSRVSLEEMKWIDWVEHSEGWDTRSQVYHHHASFIFAEGAITREVTTKIYNLVREAAELLGITGGNDKDTPKCHVLWDHIGGETARVAPRDTAFFWRGGHYVSTIKLQWTDAGKRDEVMRFIARCKAELLPHAIQQKAAYVNYIDGTVLDWQEAYYGDNYPRLQGVKTAWDPDDFFRNMQSVKPLDGGTRVIHEELPVPTPEEILASAGVQQVRKWWDAYAPRVTPESLGTLDSVDQAIDKDCKIRKRILADDVLKAQAILRAKMASQIGSSWSPGPFELSQKELIVVDVNPNPHPTPSPFLRRIVAMAPLTTAARALARSAAPRSAVRCMSATAVRPSDSTYESPFRGSQNTTKVPDFSHYAAKNGANKNLMYQYFMVGALGTITAAGAKSTVQEFLKNMSASADVLAMAKVEVDLASIPEGKNVIIKWRGKPVFIRHRTEAEIAEANKVNVASLRDPQQDEDRVKKPEWLVMLGVCTHLGCVPIGEAGDFGGWFCPCHGSHYDISGRIRKGPAPLNLEIPEYDFPEEDKLIIG